MAVQIMGQCFEVIHLLSNRTLIQADAGSLNSADPRETLLELARLIAFDDKS